MHLSKSLFRSLPKSYVVIGPDFSIMDATDGFLSERQLARDHLIKMNITELSRRNPQELKTTFEAVFQTGKSCGATHPLLDDNGSVKYLLHEIDNEELMDPKQASDVLDRITDGFFTLSHNWFFTRINPVTKVLLKKRSDEIIGKAFYEIFPLQESEIFMENFFETSKTKRPNFFEASYEDSYFSVQAYPQKDGGIAVFFRDVTEKRKSEKKLEDALATKNEFISIASHELKTPLTALRMQVEMAKRTLDLEGPKGLSPEKVKKIIDRTYKDVLRLTRLVEDMLDVSRINTGKFNMTYEFFNLEDFIDDILSRSASGIEDFNKLVTIDVTAPVMVRWDKFRIEQVILNLFTNAIRYGENTDIHFTVSAGGGYAYIKVKDHGPGIPKKDHRKIFERYERVNHDREKDGFGLGLYLCSEIIKNHHGLIKLESSLGNGASFELQIPLIF